MISKLPFVQIRRQYVIRPRKDEESSIFLHLIFEYDQNTR